ncbi:synaptic vesicle glycoprotein 2C-like [Hyposmocoma kahamanoa]|uniref:synaptic vesicle glycoprotein 2C-like n=1 Tax=Hyposmocoma kahamanoa TaxID=1477025 RepID=UPI000E6D7F3D|nr:synaptic vesicle glycoprotein 2C-like [Hyposmocoma kahamanoa]
MVTTRDTEAPANREEIPHDHLFRVTGLSSSNLEKLAQEPPADFETAIAATGYGCFNIVLMLASLPAFWSAVSVTSSVSYIFTRAQCDMQLSLLDMGTVNAITYGGMIASAMIWGFLSDTLGRRCIMIYGFFGSGLVEIMAAMSQNFTMLLVTKFASGFLFNGPFAVLLTYIAELHRTEYRARVILLTSLFYTFANITLPLLAWSLLTRDINVYLFGQEFVIHAWNLFLLASAMVPLMTGVAFIFLPESPKFLMSRGRNEEAKQVFKKIFILNTGNRKEDYPITNLLEEKSEQQGRGIAALRGGWAQISPLFKVPHAPWLFLICVIHIGAMFGSNTIRLWYPQLAAMIGSDSNKTLCSAIDPTQAPVVSDTSCIPIETDMLTYLQSSIVGAGSVLTYGIGSLLINRCGKKIVAGFCCVASAAAVLMMPFLGTGSFSVAAMVTAALAFTSLCGAALSSICVDLFPTSLRVMAMVTFLMCGRLGTIAGTVAFPALIGFGCFPPFITITAVLAAIGVACLFLPNTNLKKLE